jgi:hypothetical protein
VQAVINALYPNRIQLQLSSGDPAIGPLVTSSAVAFSPATDLEIYVAGGVASVQSYVYDFTNDQYLIFINGVIPSGAVVQVVYHMQQTPFLGSQGAIGGFSLIASVSTTADPVIPTLSVSVPQAEDPAYVAFPNTTPTFTVSATTVVSTITVGWAATAVSSIEITGSNGFSSGMISAGGLLGQIPIPNLSLGTTVDMTIQAYDSTGTAMTVNGTALSIAFVLQILNG